MIKVREETMNAVFTKYHLEGFPFSAVIHRFSEKDKNDHIHDHPFNFTTHILKGSYVERVYNTSNGSFIDVHRKQGQSHYVPAELVHEIIDLPDGECYTIITPEHWKQETSFYKFEKDAQGKTIVWKRQWNEDEFKLVENEK